MEDSYQIEITTVNIIDGGIEVFARAWKNGAQLGFGVDGSVDIERFRIFNPPILVPDVNGDVLREWTNPVTNEVHTNAFREDPAEAIMQTLVHIASVSGKSGENIIAGKIGNTTSTFYPSVDGYAGRSAAESYATIRSSAGTVSAGAGTILAVQNGLDGATRTIYRSPLIFDTAADLPDGDTISAATITITTDAFSDADSDGTVVDTFANDSAVSNSSYDIANWGGVAQSNSVLHSTLSVGGTSVFTLNATGLGNINKTGTTKFGLRSLNDFNNTAPTGNPYHFPRSADYSGTTSDPVLVVTHAAGGASGPANLKSYNTNLKINIKSIDTNLIANVKSLDTNV